MKENVKKDFQILVEYCKSFAEHLLEQQKEFYPFASYINITREITPFAVYDGDEFPLSENLIKSLKKYLEDKKTNNDLVAYVIAYDTKVTNERYRESIDALAITAIHKDQLQKITYYFPYRLLKNKVEIFEGWAEYD
jgi:hypothetical protein